MPDLVIIRYRLREADLARFLTAHSFLARDGHRPLPQDRGYLLHAYLMAATGSGPRPFRDEGSAGGLITVLAYTTTVPMVVGTDWPVQIDHRVLPATAILPGMSLGFSVRCMPLVRSRLPAAEAPTTAWEALTAVAGAPSTGTMAKPARTRSYERDVVDAARATGDVRPRDVLYLEWLGEQLSRQGAQLQTGHLDQFQMTGLVRRTQTTMSSPHRRVQTLQRPEALLTGALTVTDPTAFLVGLARGLGRHRAFGFGMLAIRPASP